MGPGNGIEVVALDAMGVLYRSVDDVTELLVPYARAHGSRLEPQRMYELYVECSLGRMSAAELWERLGTAGADDEEYCRGFQLTEGVLPAIERLRARGIGLACLSNDVSEWSLVLRRMFGLDRYVGTWVISGDIGVRKPSAEAYAALSRAVGVDPGRILFVDDRMANVRAARASGLGSVLFAAAGPEVDEDGRPTLRGMEALGATLDGWTPADAQVSIVPFTPEHTAGVIDLIVPIQREEFDIPITAEDQPDLRDIPGYYQHGSGNFWIALYQGTVVGSVALLDIGNGQAALRKMFVRPAFRGQAHRTAGRLLETLLDWTRTHQIREIYLGTTAKFLAAHRFYEKNGFIELPQSDLPAQFPLMKVDTRFYRYVVSPEPSAAHSGGVHNPAVTN